MPSNTIRVSRLRAPGAPGAADGEGDGDGEPLAVGVGAVLGGAVGIAREGSSGNSSRKASSRNFGARGIRSTCATEPFSVRCEETMKSRVPSGAQASGPPLPFERVVIAWLSPPPGRTTRALAKPLRSLSTYAIQSPAGENAMSSLSPNGRRSRIPRAITRSARVATSSACSSRPSRTNASVAPSGDQCG